MTDNHKNQLRLLRLIEEIDGYGILLLDKFGNIETWNKGAEKIKGYTSEEIIGKNISVFYTGPDLGAGLPFTLLAEATANGTAYNESWRLRKDKTTFWGAVTIMAFKDDNGEVDGFAKITRDLTERMLSEMNIKAHSDELEIKNKEIEQFVYIASHDLQEPLLTVTNFLELFKLEYQSKFDADAFLYIDFIAQATNRMKELIKNLLDYSRLGLKKKLAPVNCNLLVDTIIADMATRVKETGASVCHHDLPTIKGYAPELGQLFQNLLSNALKFSIKGAQPQVVITAEREDENWRFEVKDNGIGVSPQFKDKIFLIFQRLHPRAEYAGNGIGLAHCKKIVDLHGGKISVKPNSPRGSIFTFTIPIKPKLNVDEKF